ncbi:carbohydrate ABC transporter permease [Ruania halotolerans]|uniref:carbohydrate ABC transporter permease n=1 Tax=Ruania halotolerans TaxID=2897773 RepID=UPI001E4F140D|nr:sugar ABC transporter permease [Ruania halotolerans]UFU06979.1 sugar ABC transporter permease [Ruania halotolerans]
MSSVPAMHTVQTRPRRRAPRLRAALPFLAPALLAYVAFVVFPMAESIRLSFFEWSGFVGAEQTFVGLANYVRLFTQDAVFWTAFGNSVIWVALSLVIPMPISLTLAVALDRRLPGRALFRTVFYVPGVLAAIAVANMWRWIYNPRYGVSEGLAQALGLERLQGIQWLGNADIALFAVFVAFVWQAVGTNMVLFLAGLQAVPPELSEAAELDGAGAWQRFWNVTLPSLRPTMVVVVVLTFIGSIKVFDLIVGMTGGGPAQQTQVLALWSYQQSFTNHQYGVGNAVAVVLLVLTAAVVVPYMFWTARRER